MESSGRFTQTVFATKRPEGVLFFLLVCRAIYIFWNSSSFICWEHANTSLWFMVKFFHFFPRYYLSFSCVIVYYFTS